MKEIREIIREELVLLTTPKETCINEGIYIQIQTEEPNSSLKTLSNEDHLLEIKSLIDSDLTNEEILAKISSVMIWWSNETTNN